MAVFTRIATLRSFSGAARELGISQATASKHVQTLEEWLGIKLLERTTRRVGLTSFGESFHAQCNRILEDVADARRAGHARQPAQGTIRVAAPAGFGAMRLGPIAADFLAANPKANLEVVLADRVVDVIDEGFDIVLRLSAESGPGLTVQPLITIPAMVCASPAYLADRGRPATPAGLSEHDCLIDPYWPGSIWRFTGPGGEHAISVSGRMRAASLPLLREAAIGGAGILMAPAYAVSAAIQSGRLAQLLPGYTPDATALWAAMPAGRQWSGKVRGFLSFLSERLSPAHAAEAAVAPMLQAVSGH